MPATLSQIKGWIEKAQENGATHLLIMCDTFDFTGPGSSCCYPVEIMPGENPEKRLKEIGDCFMECYSFTGNHTEWSHNFKSIEPEISIKER